MKNGMKMGLAGIILAGASIFSSCGLDQWVKDVVRYQLTGEKRVEHRLPRAYRFTDLNGDGKIQREEVEWGNPIDSEPIRVIGSSSSGLVFGMDGEAKYSVMGSDGSFLVNGYSIKRGYDFAFSPKDIPIGTYQVIASSDEGTRSRTVIVSER